MKKTWRFLVPLALFALIVLFAGWFLDPASVNPGKLYLGFNTPTGTPTPARRIWSGFFIAMAIYFFYGRRRVDIDFERRLTKGE